MLEYETRDQSGSVYRAVDSGDIWDNFDSIFGLGSICGGSEDVCSDQSSGDSDDSDILTVGVRIDYDFANMTVTSNTGYKDHDFFYNEDYDGTPLNINDYRQDQEGEYFQQELRLTSNTDGPLSWYAGVSYYQEDIETTFTNIGREDAFCNYYGNVYYPGNGITDCASLYAYYGSPFTPSSDGLLSEPGRIIGDYSGWSVYVDVNYQLTEAFDLSVGVRYTDDEKDFNINVPAPESQYGPLFAYGFTTDGDIRSSDSWDDAQVRVVGRYYFNDDHLVYASYTEGFKSGGFGSFALVDAAGDRVPCCITDVSQASGARSRSFRPETVESYEFGYKGSLFEGRAKLGITGFIYDYKDLQISFFDVGSGANTVENVGEVDGAGVEATANLTLNDHWSFYLAASWLDTEANGIQQVCDGPTPDSCEGSDLFWAPEFTTAGVLNARYPFLGGEIVGSLDFSYEDERGGGWGGFPETMIDSYVEVSARVKFLSNDNWSAGFYVENLTDEFTWDGINNNGGILPSHFFGPRRPRTFGVTFSYTWD
jgi:iron complex outermembrane receptor protein